MLTAQGVLLEEDHLSREFPGSITQGWAYFEGYAFQTGNEDDGRMIDRWRK